MKVGKVSWIILVNFIQQFFDQSLCPSWDSSHILSNNAAINKLQIFVYKMLTSTSTGWWKKKLINQIRF